MNKASTIEPGLKRTLSLPMVVLYGLGVTIGAGIYVLIGETAGRAGMSAPLAFVIASLVMACPAASFAELTGRLPFAAAEAHFVDEAFHMNWLTLAVGLAVASVGVVSSATIGLGSAGYIAQVVDLPHAAIVTAIFVLMGLVAAWGIRESILFAGLLTLIEIGGLLAILAGAAVSEADILYRLDEISVALDRAHLPGLAAASLIAFFAFIGFENIDSIAEETKNPQRTIGYAIFITLGLSTLLYVAVATVAVLAIDPAELALTEAPLAALFSRMTGMSPVAITLIAIVATLNGIIVQIIMTSRVLYGLANKKQLPAIFALVHSVTRTPLLATGIAAGSALVLALAFPISGLAEWTSRITLAIFILACSALVRIKLRGTPPPPGTFIVPLWVPVLGVLLCGVLLVAGG
ncbi:APC family permease [Taklimakanibacter lacteus]|uniref:APC family permease n=1 Tax=Taklimakanibacter lacteus TaxID=2268456 RepID=UPI000E667180